MISSKIFLLLSVLCVGFSSTFMASCGDRRESFYPTLADATKAGEITRGWIPDFLPESAHAIHIIYDPSSPRTYCAFEFSPDDSQRLMKNLTDLDGLPPPVKNVQHSGVSWWPAMLSGNLDVEKIHRARFKLYKVEEPGPPNSNILLFVIDWTNRRVFFYRTNK